MLGFLFGGRVGQKKFGTQGSREKIWKLVRGKMPRKPKSSPSPPLPNVPALQMAVLGVLSTKGAENTLHQNIRKH